jgi:hypothetical protein
METSRQAVEQNLSEIAFASVSEKTPALMDFYIGFDLIEKNDSGTRAAGLMGFKIGSQLVYIPVFFLNGKLKGTEVIYLKNSDIFVSNSEQWVSYIISQSQGEMGEGADEKEKGTPDTAEVSKALDLFVRPPASAGKTASEEDYSLVELDDLIDRNRAGFSTSFSLINFIKKASREDFDKIAEVISSPDIFEKVIKFYSVSEIKEAFGERQKEAAEEIEEEVQEVQIIRPEDVLSQKSASLSVEEKEQTMLNGYLIKGAKEKEECAKICIEQENEKFNEVTESGVYQILNSMGKLVEALVLVGVKPLDGIDSSSGGSSMKLVVDPKTGKHTEANEVYFRTGNEVSKFDEDKRKELLDGAKSVSSASPSKTYVLLDKKLSAYGPFKVENKERVDGKATLSCSPAYGFSYGCGERLKIKQVDVDDRNIGRVGDAIYVPSCCKLFELTGDKYSYSDDNRKIKPGSFSSVIDALLRNGAEKAYFEKSGRDVNARIAKESVSFSNRGDLVFHLCKECDFSVGSAEKVAEELYGKNKRSLTLAFVKKAYPEVPEPNVSAGTMRDGTPQVTQATTTEEMISANPQGLPATDPSFGTWDQASPEDMSLLERAADSDSREVFDPAMVGILVRTTRAQNIVQEYIPEFVDNLDRMIRLLLLFYWHNAEFAENYGIDQMADFEDLLLSTIKNTGKTILFLKQKAVESSTGRSDIF